MPKLKDSSWQARETATLFLGKLSGKFDKPEVTKSLVPMLRDSVPQVREAAVLSLGDKVKLFPPLAKEFINILKTDASPEVKFTVAKYLQTLNTPEAKEIKPLIQQAAAEVKVVVMIPGVDDKILGLNPFSKRKKEWSADLQLRKLLELADIKVLEHTWPGNIVGKEFQDAQLRLDDTMLKALKMAGEHGKVMVIMYSGGNLVGERFLSTDLDSSIKQAFKENRIDLVSLGSPSWKNFARLDANWENIALDKDGVYQIFGLHGLRNFISNVHRFFDPKVGVDQHNVVYPFSRDVTKEPIDAHGTFKDPRVQSSILHWALPRLQMPQLDKMLKEQDLSKLKFSPKHGYYFEAPDLGNMPVRPHVEYGSKHLRDPFVPQPPMPMPSQQPIRTPQPVYTPQQGSWPGQYNFNIRAPDNYYKQPFIMPQTPIMPPTPIIQPSFRR